MALVNVVGDVLLHAERLRESGVANEANTKHHLIEPVMAALGWNLNDFTEVDREYKVFDGTFLDYALRVNGKPRLFLEAKALGKSLADKQFIAQTVNYANNEGVVWCVLTNGLVYQVYKSNEPVQMDRKLLFEVDLPDAAQSDDLAQAVASLEALSREAVADGRLDEWGEAVFVDVRTRAALAKLGESPSRGFLNAVTAALEGPKIGDKELHRSLARLLTRLAVDRQGALVGRPPDETTKPNLSPPPGPPVKPKYDVEQHTTKKPSAIVDLFEQVDSYATSLGSDVERRPAKYYVGYFAGKKSFFTMELQKTRIWVYLSLPPGEAKPWNDEEMRDVREIGHFGMGDTEFNLHSSEQLPRLYELVKAAYLRNRK